MIVIWDKAVCVIESKVEYTGWRYDWRTVEECGRRIVNKTDNRPSLINKRDSFNSTEYPDLVFFQ